MTVPWYIRYKKSVADIAAELDSQSVNDLDTILDRSDGESAFQGSKNLKEYSQVLLRNVQIRMGSSQGL